MLSTFEIPDSSWTEDGQAKFSKIDNVERARKVSFLTSFCTTCSVATAPVKGTEWSLKQKMYRSCRPSALLWGCLMVALSIATVRDDVIRVSAAAKAPPELSSTLLELHKQYLSQPPHDISLYRTLQVSPNATAAQITRSYRKLSRIYHPDKLKLSTDNNDDALKAKAQERLNEIQKAYQVLKDDSSRLPYHKFGLIDTTLAVVLLLGPGQIHKYPELQHSLTPLHHELLELMGYDRSATLMTSPSTSKHQVQRRRLLILAARLVERIRPLVETTVDPSQPLVTRAVDPSIVFQYTTAECDRLKSLPMGAHIIRCIGRAYRHAGQRYLDRLEQQQKLSTELTLAMQTQWRSAQQYWTAALASGKAIYSEKAYAKKAKKHKKRKEAAKEESETLMVEYPELGDDSSLLGMSSNDDDSSSDQGPSEEELEEAEQLKAHHTILTALQVEALWKTSKIDLDRTIQKACNMILDGDYFFFPSHQSNRPSEWSQPADGWVTRDGKTVYATAAREKAAKAMVLIGTAMVQSSKQGTAWME